MVLVEKETDGQAGLSDETHTSKIQVGGEKERERLNTIHLPNTLFSKSSREEARELGVCLLLTRDLWTLTDLVSPTAQATQVGLLSF